MRKYTLFTICVSSVCLFLFGCGKESSTVVATGTTQPDVSVLSATLIRPLGIVETTMVETTTVVPTTTTTVPKPTTTKPKPTTTKPVTTKAPTTTVPATTGDVSYHGSVQDIIRAAANEFGVSPDRLLRVARCESTFNPSARNGQYGGLFQFSDKTFNWFASMSGISGSKWDAVSSSRVAAWAFANGYASHWECK